MHNVRKFALPQIIGWDYFSGGGKIHVTLTAF